jgi:hypothetical protein
MNEHAHAKDAKHLRKELWIYRVCLILCLLLLAVAGILWLADHKEQHRLVSTESRTFPDIVTAKNLPYYQKVIDLITPLEYSGLPTFLKPKIRLSIDFDKQVWTLHNLHEYTREGDILLDNRRFGLCGELAASIFKPVRHLFGPDYSIKFAKVSESGFFLAPQSTHIVLLAQHKSSGASYVIDPSFHRYGRQDDLDQYLFFGVEDSLSFVDQKAPDITFEADHAMPLLIRNNFLIHFSVGKAEGKFDRNNFSLSCVATERYKFSGRYLFAIRKINGETQQFENKWLIPEILSPEDCQTIRNALLRFFRQIEETK